jgi:protease I
MKSKKWILLFISFVVFSALLQSCACFSERKPNEPLQVAIMVAEGFHDTEAYLPMGYLINQGYEVTIIGPAVGEVKSYNTDFTIVIQKAISEVSVDDFDALILPGGKGPAVLREDAVSVSFVSDFAKSGKVIAAVCHGPQVLITADVVTGYNIGGLIKMKDEIESAGATYIDESVVVDRNIVTAKIPKDLYYFSKAIDETVRRIAAK